jgi:hypothetical protein
MVKGVNKLILEVANPDSEFFERAIFFVKPQMKDTPPAELGKGANALINRQSRDKRRKTPRFGRGSRFRRVLAFAGTAGLGAAVAAIVMRVLGG